MWTTYNWTILYDYNTEKVHFLKHDARFSFDVVGSIYALEKGKK